MSTPRYSIGPDTQAVAPQLKSMVLPTIGIDSVDVDAMAARGITVANSATPENFEGLAEATVLLMLTLIMHRKVSEIAYGRQRLVEIAVALAMQPRVLLLDEPAAGIPGSELGLLIGAIESLPAEIAVLMIEHDMDMVRRFATQVSVLVQGELLVSGTPRDVMSHAEVQAVYLGAAGSRRFERKQVAHA